MSECFVILNIMFCSYPLLELRNGMPHKIGFTVISWSGHEGNYSAKKLMVHAPTVTGWRSTRLMNFILVMYGYILYLHLF